MPRTTEWRLRTRLLKRTWHWAVWEVRDSRPSYDVPLLPHMREPYDWLHDPHLDIRQIAERWPLLSEPWPSDS